MPSRHDFGYTSNQECDSGERVMKCERYLSNGNVCRAEFGVIIFKGLATCRNCYKDYIKEVSL